MRARRDASSEPEEVEDLMFWARITTFLDVKDVSVLLTGPFFNFPTLTTFF